jgi:hypothetical protein
VILASSLHPARAPAQGRFRRTPKEHRTFEGIVFDSQRECARYAELRRRERAGLIFNLERQPAFVVEIAGRRFCKYTADFSYALTPGGTRIIEDCKSSGTAKDPAYRLRKKAAQLFFGITIHEVTQTRAIVGEEAA